MELKSFRLFFSKPIHLMESDFVSSSKSYFLSFGIEKLEQTGKEYIINGEIVKARKEVNGNDEP